MTGNRLALCIALMTFLAAAPAAGAATWSTQSVPASQSNNGQGNAVSCAAATACTEVGYSINPLGVQQPSAQGWNGTSWTLQTVPLPSGFQFGTLRGVSCTSATACTAVGGVGFSEFPSRPLAVRWNGTSWTLQTVPLPPGTFGASFNAVSCSSATACMAVGAANLSGHSVGIAESWNGTTWTVQTIQNPSDAVDLQLGGVSCTSATACVAVGHYMSSSQKFFPDKVVAERWNGTSWAIQTTPLPAGTTDATLAAVSCSASTACTAVGGSATTGAFPNKTLAERWDGKSWTVQPTPNPSTGTPSLSGVSCPTATDCTAVGSLVEFGHDPVAEQWNGTSWSLQSAPSPSGLPMAQLSAVSCTAAAACTAIGGAAVSIQVPPATLAERWNGTAWTIQASQDGRGAVPSEVNGVSCPTASSCIAVGDFNHSGGRRRMLAESWNGTKWTSQPVPLPSNTNGVLSAVSCTSPTACTAVGQVQSTLFVSAALAERWDGAAWTVQSTPADPTGSTNATLEAVSCPSATFCMAVGKSVDEATGRSRSLVAQWNGTSWTLNPAPSLARETFSEFTGVSCASATSCMAAGGFSTATGALRSDSVFAEQWNGTSWRAFTPRAPTGTTYANFTGVSCTAANACTAAGGFSTQTGDSFPRAPLAERWNGSNWTVQTTPNPASTGFTAAACPTATACTAVGSSFAEGWDGTSWTAQTLPFVSQGEAELSAVSCPLATTCTATGRIVSNYLTVPLSANSVFIGEMFVPLAERSVATASAAATHTGIATTAARPAVRVIRLGDRSSHPHELAVLAG